MGAMMKKLTATIIIEIAADQSAVWNGLTDPELIKQYFFGTHVVTDWKKGSPIFFRGEWEGKQYEDKGTILDIEEGRFVRYKYWSSMSGTADISENYSTIQYTLSGLDTKTVLTISQDGIASEEQRDHSEKNWKLIMEGLKQLIEKRQTP